MKNKSRRNLLAGPQAVPEGGPVPCQGGSGRRRYHALQIGCVVSGPPCGGWAPLNFVKSGFVGAVVIAKEGKSGEPGGPA